jgi:chromosome partitioning protein
LNCCPPSGAEIEQARGIIIQLGAGLAPVEIHLRKAFSLAQQDGLAAQEYEPSGKAAHEIQQLYRYSFTELYEGEGLDRGETETQPQRIA